TVSTHRRCFIRSSTRKTSRQKHFARPAYPLKPFRLLHNSDMSAITPPSFVDDGGSFTKRIPHSLDPRHVAHWIDATGSDTSGYTGSFIDDGADMLLPHNAAPGFGQIDPRFYMQRKRKEGGKEEVWNDDVQKAVSGDIQRNLAKVRGLGGLEVKRHGRGAQGGEKKNKEKEKDTVKIVMPPTWGTFVIKTDDGRVIIVDREGEFDSGPQKATSERPAMWVKAASSIEMPSPTAVSMPPSPPKHRTSHSSEERRKRTDKRHSHEHKHRKSHHKHRISPRLKALTPIQESEYEEQGQPSAEEDAPSPTLFLMTGGASGWPSRTATSVATPAGSAPERYDSPGLNSLVKSRSHIRVPPGGWLSPPESLVKSVAASEQSWVGNGFEQAWEGDRSPRLERSETSHRSHTSEKSHRSHKSQKSQKQNLDNVSTRSYSTYRAPTVEDAPDTSSEEKRGYAKMTWGGSVKSNSVKDWGGSLKSGTAVDEKFTHSPAASQLDWGGDDGRSETSWDGYERVKTVSEASVAGTGSERSSLGSHGSRTSHAHSERRSQASRQSWGSEKARVDDDGWGGSQKRSDGGWGSSKRGSERSWKERQAVSEAKGSKYANGYDEDNETYLNENWGGTPVRVGKRRMRVAGWE
ncbi:uncharacterized protein K460DRAFT_279361, partial [Cucurbitaria berberidis CBS 394.84]